MFHHHSLDKLHHSIWYKLLLGCHQLRVRNILYFDLVQELQQGLDQLLPDK